MQVTLRHCRKKTKQLEFMESCLHLRAWGLIRKCVFQSCSRFHAKQQTDLEDGNMLFSKPSSSENLEMCLFSRSSYLGFNESVSNKIVTDFRTTELLFDLTIIGKWLLPFSKFFQGFIRYFSFFCVIYSLPTDVFICFNIIFGRPVYFLFIFYFFHLLSLFIMCYLTHNQLFNT